VASSFIYSALLNNFSQLRLIQVVQGTAVVTIVLNVIALWKQEARDPAKTSSDQPRPAFRDAWRVFRQEPGALRLLFAVGFGTAAFNMQDIVLEPYGAEIFKLSVSATSLLTALLAGGALCAFALSARWLSTGSNPHRLAAVGVMTGIVAFCFVVFAAPLESPFLFRLGTVLIGFGGGLFAVSTLTAAMSIETRGYTGLALGAWGATQATAAGVAIAAGGAIRDIVSTLSAQGALGEALMDPSIGYSFVYHLEIFLLFVTLAVIGPLARTTSSNVTEAYSLQNKKFGLAEFPG